ncbi:hypothetical protein [Umezawaea sp. NPDC059074]|uniref:hypothetical protein n=1 Tax=Umezawaea sp. NPDC059074 TaxID=3346716 RepID=UPI0036C4C647
MRRVLLLSAVVALATAGCAASPASAGEVCDAYLEMGAVFAGDPGRFADGVFHEANVLSSVAGRYEGSDSLQADAEALGKIADSRKADVVALEQATTKIAALCGHSAVAEVSGGRE